MYEPETCNILKSATSYILGLDDTAVYNARIAFEISLAIGMIDAMGLMIADDSTLIGLIDEPLLVATFISFCMLLGIIYTDANCFSTDGNDCIA